MIDINLLRDDVTLVASLLKKRGFDLDTESFSKLEASRKKIQVRTQELQEIRNENSKKIGVEKAKGSNTDSLMKLVSETSSELKALEVELSELQEKINDFLLLIPNIPHPSVPDGITEEDNVVVRECGTKKLFDFWHNTLFIPQDKATVDFGLDQLDTKSKILKTLDKKLTLRLTFSQVRPSDLANTNDVKVEV